MELTGVLFYAAMVSLVLLSTALVLVFIVLLSRNTVAARVVVLEYLTSLIVAFAVVFSWMTKNSVFLNVAIIVALIGFMGTIAYGRYIRYKKK